MGPIDTISVVKDGLFSQEEQEKIEETLKLFEGLARKPLKDDPERMHKVREIYCEAEKKEKK